MQACARAGKHPGSVEELRHLAPADLKKEGGIRAADNPGHTGCIQLSRKKELPDYIFIGELSLDGSIRPIHGALPIAIAARTHKIPNLIIAEANTREAAVVSGLKVYPVRSLIQVVHLTNQRKSSRPTRSEPRRTARQSSEFTVDFKQVRGQQSGKRALEAASACGHNILMIGQTRTV